MNFFVHFRQRGRLIVAVARSGLQGRLSLYIYYNQILPRASEPR